jgi:hypothetical protein
VWIIVGLMVLVLGGCANWGKQLYLAHDTKLGIDASINTATSSGTLDLGYDRRFVTWVPRSVEIKDANPETAKEVMSVLACSELRVGIVSIDYYDESLATGAAATKFANALAQKDGQVAKDYFECFTKHSSNAVEEKPEAGDGQ